jgi:hypothetical protein
MNYGIFGRELEGLIKHSANVRAFYIEDPYTFTHSLKDYPTFDAPGPYLQTRRSSMWIWSNAGKKNDIRFQVCEACFQSRFSAIFSQQIIKKYWIYKDEADDLSAIMTV